MPETNRNDLDIEDLRRTVAEVLDVDAAEVTDEARFIEDLGCDSLLALEIAVVLEKKYAVKFRDAELQEVTCLPKAHALVAAKLGGQ
jgi:acyl carrier protein